MKKYSALLRLLLVFHSIRMKFFIEKYSQKNLRCLRDRAGERGRENYGMPLIDAHQCVRMCTYVRMRATAAIKSIRKLTLVIH